MNLDASVAAEITQLAQKLDQEGKLLSRARLTECYRLFRQRFGTDVLANLDGEELLMTMHARGNTDSLVYWLEFKNDDEFPALFGSIAGGSSFNYGVFYSKSKATWITGSPKKPEEITILKAIDIARNQRDELVHGAEALAEFKASAEDPAYQNLQLYLDLTAPTVSDSAWGHKYFSLLFPDILDDYHNPDYARFHLIKLLQLPPSGAGRYLMGGRFVALSRQFDLPINNFTTILNEKDGRTPYTYWRIGTREGDTGPSRWEMMKTGNCVAIGWPNLGDLSDVRQIAELPKIKETIKERLRDHYQKGETVLGIWAAQIAAFTVCLAPPDVVIAMDGSNVLGIGKVTGGYRFVSGDPFPHQLPVVWLSQDEWTMDPPEQLRSTVRRLGKFPQHLVEIEKRIYGATSIVGTAARSPISGRDSPVETLPPTPPLTGVPARIQSVLERKGQVIVYGPPGTGKTHWAEITALELAARSWFQQAYGQLSSDDQASLQGEAVRLVCFHPAYGYEDFLEGYRPDLVNGQMTFTLRDGVFKRLCDEAAKKPDRSFYLVIDEINRGDIPRIFGELLTVLEKNKRGKSILLPVTGTALRVPPNVFVIGTMNTADRSIALLDAALRRRFGFIELMPDSATLASKVPGGLPLGMWLDDVNRNIVNRIGRDGRNLQIGHSYFLTIANMHDLARVLEEDIMPLLQEYCCDDYSLLESILGSGLVDAQKQSIRKELFARDRSSDLIAALQAPFADLATTLIAHSVDDGTPMDEGGEEDTISIDSEEPESENGKG